MEGPPVDEQLEFVKLIVSRLESAGILGVAELLERMKSA